MAAKLGIEEGMRLHAKYDGEFYPAVVTAVSSSKARAKKPVKVKYSGWDDEVWVSISSLKNKKLGLKGEAPAKAEAPKAKAKAKVKAKAKAKVKDEEKKKRDPVKFIYFALWAKGPGIALALEHSGIDWVGEFATDWKEKLKPTTPWLELPVLDIPGIGMIGHEAAIFNYIGERSKKMKGFNMSDFTISQQLMNEAEDIYKKLSQIKRGEVTEEQAKAFWAGEDATTHNKDFGIKVFLSLLDKFHTKCNNGEGKYTKSGITVGECKLFTMLHAAQWQTEGCLDGYANVKAFYERFKGLEKTKAVMEGTGKMPGTFNKYFGA